MNNATWIVDEFTEWIEKSVREVHNLRLNAPGHEGVRLQEKESTLRMVKTKLEQLKYD